jgi:peptide/nickel transport system substrate-binding protein
LVALILVACGPTPEPQVVRETVKETVIVEGTPQVVEKEVTRVVEVEKPVEVVVTEEAAADEPVSLLVGFEINEATSMDPHQQYDTPGVMVGLMAYESLTRLRPEDWTKPAPGLAERWDVSDDATEYIFYLRPGVTFQSGNPLTAQDVEFSLWRLAHKGAASSWLAADWIKDIEVIDDLTLKITLNFPDASFPMVLASPMHSIVDSKTVMEHGGVSTEDAAENDQATPWLDQNSAGTGPYILKSWEQNSEIALEANPNYWGGKPQIDRLVVKHALDPTAAFQMVQRGDLDILLRLNPDLVEQAQADPNLKVEKLPNLDTFYWLMTCDPELSEPLSDPRVRKAMALAVDREGIVEAALNGNGVLPPSVLPLGLAGVDPADTLPRDLDGARDLLAEAGYPDGFEVTLSYPTSSVWDIVAAKVQSDLAEVGISVELEPMDFGLLLTRAFDNRDIAWLMSDWIPDYADVSNWTSYFGVPDEGAWPWALRCENNLPPELTAATEAIVTETDPVKRLEAVKAWQAEMMDFAYAWNLYQINEHVAMGKDVQGFKFIPMGYTHWGDLSVESGD